VVRRRFARYALDVPVTMRHVQAPEDSERHGRTRSIGEGGLSAVIAADVAPGELVELEITFSAAAPPLRLRAIARYRSRLYHGFEFVRLEPDQAAAIRAATHGQEPLP
jgi:hypothetical protein